MEGYNLQQVSHKTRDFSNPMYDAVQAGTNVDPSLGNGSGELTTTHIFSAHCQCSRVLCVPSICAQFLFEIL